MRGASLDDTDETYEDIRGEKETYQASHFYSTCLQLQMIHELIGH